MTFWPFLASWAPWGPPLKGPAKELGALGSLLRVPCPSIDPTPSPESRQHILFSLGGSSGTPHPYPLYDTGCGKNQFGVVIFAELSFFSGTRYKDGGFTSS